MPLRAMETSVGARWHLCLWRSPLQPGQRYPHGLPYFVTHSPGFHAFFTELSQNFGILSLHADIGVRPQCRREAADDSSPAPVPLPPALSATSLTSCLTSRVPEDAPGRRGGAPAT